MIISESQIEYVQKMLEELGFGNAPEAEQQRMLELLEDRFQKVIIVTMLQHLNDEQKERFSKFFDNPETLEDNVSLLAAEIPGLDKALEQALEDEYEILKENLTGV